MFDGARSWLAYQLAPPAVKAAASQDGGFVDMIHRATAGKSTFSSNVGAAELLDAYKKMPWLRAVVNKVSASVGMTTWKLFVATRPGTKEFVRVPKFQCGTTEVRHRLMKASGMDVREIEDHPLLTLLNSGSPLLPGSSNMRMVQMYFDIVGEAVLLKVRGQMTNSRTKQQIVTQLVPIPPHWVKGLPTPKDPHYGIQFGRMGTIDKIPAEDVIFWRDPDPLDPYGRGVGTARALADELQANDAASRTIRSRLENNAIPPFIAMPEAGTVAPTIDQLKRVREDWDQKLRGPTKGQGVVHFLLSRFKLEKLANTFEELSLIPLLQNQRDTILQVYGVPPEIFGIVENSNRATIEAAEFLMGKFVLVPRLEFNRSVLQQMLVPEFDERLILEYESPVAQDAEMQATVMKDHEWAFQADEIRDRAGLPPLENDAGKVHAVPLSVMLEESLADVTGLEPEGPTDDDPPEPPEDEEDEPDDEKGVFKSIHMMRANQVAQEGVKDETMRRATEDTVREAVIAAGKKRLTELAVGIAFDIHDPIVIQLVGETAGRQIKRINETTRRRLASSLAEGFEEGEDINQLARRVRDTFKAASGKRSVTIARTESQRALNAGSLAATKQAGFPGKQWLSSRDARVRDTHRKGSLDGQIVGIDEDFVSASGARGPHPGALGRAEEDIHCRCTLLSVAKMPKKRPKKPKEVDGGEETEIEIEWAQGLDTEEKRIQFLKDTDRVALMIERRMQAAFRRGLSAQLFETINALYRIASIPNV